jgi:hypothetical protein
LPATQLLPRIGGRVIDLAITIPDEETTFKYINEMNKMVQTELQSELKQRQVIPSFCISF